MTSLRAFRHSDQDAIVALSLRAWEPVFDSLHNILGEELFQRLRGDWRAGQAAEVRAVLTDSHHRVWVAEDANGSPVGFVAAKLHHEQEMGEVYMIAVDPSAQNRGIGAALAEIATDWLRESGMRTAMIETGGDSGHAPARRLYEKAGYTPLPTVRLFKPL
jgi:ribosomal protein S18 acetylase RimI-like enzyme